MILKLTKSAILNKMNLIKLAPAHLNLWISKWKKKLEYNYSLQQKQ